MDLSFSCMELYDFKSFAGGPHTLDFSKHPLGLCYVKGWNQRDERLGSNGSGKSSLWDALVWCLYGKTSDNLRNPDIKSWFGGAKSIVTVDVIIDEVEYAIRRQANPNRLTINDKEVGQEEVEILIGLSFDTFLNTILLGQGRPLFFDLDPSAKLQLFSDVLTLTRWEERSKQASAAAQAADQDLTKVERDIARVEARVSQVKDDLSKNKKRRDSWAEENQAQMEEVREKLVPVEAQLDAFKIKLAEAEVEHDMASTMYQLSEKDSKAMFEELFQKRDRMSIADTTKRSYDKAIKELEAEIEEIGDTEICPTCGQDLEGTNLDKHRTAVSIKIRDRRKDITALKFDELYDDYAKFQKKTNSFTDLLAEEEKKIKRLRESIENWRRRCGETEVTFRSLKDTLERLESASNPHANSVRDGTRDLKKLREEMEDLKTQQKDIESTIRRTKYWVKGFKDIRLWIMEEVLQELEMVTTAMMQEVGLVDWYVKYNIEKETTTGTIKRGLDLAIYNPDYGKPVKWKSWSGGEAQRLRVIGSLALAEVLLNHAGVVTDMEILDEPIKHMGEEGVEDLCQLLSDRSRALGRQVWFIDHQTVEGSLFDSVVEVVKDENRVSSIVRG